MLPFVTRLGSDELTGALGAGGKRSAAGIDVLEGF